MKINKIRYIDKQIYMAHEVGRGRILPIYLPRGCFVVAMGLSRLIYCLNSNYQEPIQEEQGPRLTATKE